ncbi:MAG: hypothetical protein KF774_17815 [Planctomyces sp.]|nr:hypothetical protein [Planctomyces sp.]
MAQTAAERIAILETLLDSGAKTITVDGVVTAIDPDAIRARIAELKEEDPEGQSRRPRLLSIDMSGAF